MFSHWGKRDPIALYEEYLVEEGVGREELAQVESRVEAEVENAQEEALRSRAGNMPPGESALVGVYASDRSG
jgi:TPP-dependent pyruvate/acetoin dehydrogenase alpha subunit